MENILFTAILQSIKAQLRIKAVCQLPTENVYGKQIYDNHQVKKFLPKRVIGDIGRSDMIHRCVKLEDHQTGETL